MRLTHLSLTNFRNYARLELGLSDRLTVFQGANVEGKTNLLEAIHLLATGRSLRATVERELINWLALESTLPYARLTGEIGEGEGAKKLELVLELARERRERRPGRAETGADQRLAQACARPGGTAVGRAFSARVRQPGGGRAARAPPLSRHRPVPDRAQSLPRVERVPKGVTQLAGCATRAAIPASSRSGTARWPSTAVCCSTAAPRRWTTSTASQRSGIVT